MNIPAFIDRTEPSSPTPAPSVAPSRRTLAQLNALGRYVYHDVWTEFYAWEPAYCARAIEDALAWRTHVAQEHPVDVQDAQRRVARLRTERIPNTPPKPPRDALAAVVAAITHLADDGEDTTTPFLLPLRTVDASDVPPHPPYESCPPAARSVPAPDPHTLPFLPYADDARFDAVAYQRRFAHLEWATPFDPDAELIQIETVRRLYVVHGVAIPDVDRMRLFKRCRSGHNAGLLWDLAQRDVFHWTAGAFKLGSAPEKALPSVYTPATDDLRQRLMSHLKVFCPSINCLHAMCETHGKDHAHTFIPSRKPALTGQSMILSEGVPCGPDCFRHIQDFDKFMETVPPSPTESRMAGSTDALETILGIAPDIFPCQLAVICLKPCKQVFVQRLQHFPDHMIFPSGDEDPPRENGRPQQQKKKKAIFVDEAIRSCPQPRACAHSGPCSSNNCTCYADKQHCSLMCRCGVKCERQWKGCSCKLSNACCTQTRFCECLRKERECIPGICIDCDAGGKFGKPCGNTKMQCMISKPMEIKCGTYGLGAFACQDMRTNNYLGSYTGYILADNEHADQIRELSDHIGHNYLFEVSSPQDIDNDSLPIYDATYLGNSTRFLNHKADGKENVEARNIMVIGEHQIGFFTKKNVKKGEELFLDYGDKYWKQ